MTRYIWKLNNQDICGMGLESCVLSLRSGGPDTLAWTYERDISGSAPFAVHDIVTLICQTYDEEEDEITEVKTMFKGRVASCQASDTARSSGWQITAENGWGDLRRVVMTQKWKSWNPSTETLTDRDVPRVVLGIAEDGTAQNTGEIIEEIVTLAAGKGAMLSAGTISPDLTIPPTELVDTVADAALRQILAYHPDHMAWIEDGDKLQVHPPSGLPSFAINPCASGMEVAHDPQTDETPGGVVIVWERTHSVDGSQRIERIHQTAGSAGGWPPPIYMTIPLAGTNVTTKFEVIETRTLPVTGSTSASVAKKFLKGLLPQLATADEDDLLITAFSVIFADPVLDDINEETEAVNPNSKPVDRGSDQPSDFPRMLVGGQVQPWFPSGIKQYDALLNAVVRYKGSVAEVKDYVGSGLTISEPITITNALPKTYRVKDEFTQGEEPIAGLAESYWSAISGAKDNGTVSGHIGNSYRDLRPGRRVSVDGRFSTPSPINATRFDLLAGTFRATYGAREFLNPKTIADLAKTIARNAPTWRSPAERSAALAGGADGIQIREGGTASPRNATPRRSDVWPWDLLFGVGDETDFRVNVGTIIADMKDVGTPMSISDATSTFEAASGKLVFLEFSAPLETLTCTLKCETSWADYPSPYESSGEGETTTFASYRFPLWEFLSAMETPDCIPITDDLYARRMSAPSHYACIRTLFKDATPANRTFTVPILTPYHRAVP